MRPFLKLVLKLRFLLLLSSLWANMAMAHEVLPVIADFETKRGVLSVKVRLNLEAQLSDIDLDRLTNTDFSENRSNYDVLRAEPGPAISARAAQIVETWNALPFFRAGDTALSLQLESAETREEVNPELPRQTTIRLTAPLPGDAKSVTIAWPLGAGPFVLRQKGVKDPFTGFLNGGVTTPQISLSGGRN